MDAPDRYRLPRSVIPERYELTLAPDLDAATFRGEEKISVRVAEQVTEIVLNALDLDIESAELSAEDGRRIPGTPVLDAEHGRVAIRLEQPAEPGPWDLAITFAGTLNDKLRGFYRSTFKVEGKERVIATTQFEPTDARRAFPCWDEPDRKAVFSVSLDVVDGLTAVSNSASTGEERLPDGRRRIRFADTIAMSTYLVAFVVGPLEQTESLDVDGVPLRVVHVPEKGHLTDYALEVGGHALRFFTSWFGIPYPGDKIDLIALPDFAAGAMENLGAITFRESVLLIDPDSASRVELERVADVICHELAHMWFGDLVTMSWWNGLWLNEAFATFMEMLCVDAFRPDWERWVTFGRSKAAAMSTDGLPSTRPIEYPVGRPAEAEGMFDILTYEKGAGILRMLERYLGAEEFRRGIRRYLDAHLYSNAETTDLWDAIEEATSQPARSTMDSWIFQGGYPVVTAARGASGGSIELKQQPFRYLEGAAPGPDGSAGDEDAIGTAWKVPVIVRAAVGGEENEHRVLLDDGGAALALPGDPDWVVVNAGGSGFYRVRYSGGLLDQLTGAIDSLDPTERFNLVSDTWAAVLAGLSSLSDFVAVVRLLGDERDPSVWGIVVGALNLLDHIAADLDRPALQEFTRQLLRPAFVEVGWTPSSGEAERTGTLRATLLDGLGGVGGDGDVRERARKLHADALGGGPPLEPDLAAAIVSVVAASGGRGEFETFLTRFRDPDTPQEELRYLYGLAGFADLELAQEALDLSLTEVRTQNAGFLIQLLLANRTAGPASWAFVKSRWDDLLARLPDNTIPRMLEGVSTLCHPEIARDVHTFLDTHPVRSGQRTVDQIRQRLDVNVHLARREAGRLGATLSS